MRTATENILADFLREIHDVIEVRKQAEAKAKAGRELDPTERPVEKDSTPPSDDKEKADDASQTVFLSDPTNPPNQDETSPVYKEDHFSDIDSRDVGG